MNPQSSLGELVAERPSRSKVFEKHGIDYCCGGARTLETASRDAKIDVEALLSELQAQTVASTDRDWRGATVAELVPHILEAHHEWLRREMPRISNLAEKVARVHGAGHPELVELRDVYESLRAEMEPHLVKEERILFPAALALEATGTATMACHGGPARLEGPVAQMESEHVLVGSLLERILDLTDRFTAREDACNTWRAYWDALAELDANTRAHVHLENEVLHRRIRLLEEQAATAN